MSRRRRKSNERSRQWIGWLVVGIAAVLVVSLSAAVFIRRSAEDRAAAFDAAHYTPPPLPTKNAIPPPAKITLTNGMKTLFIGDSWTAGYAANPYTDGFAFRLARDLHLNFTIAPKGGGTGYNNPGPDVGDYEKRIAAMPTDPAMRFVLIQGGLNDQGRNMGQLEADTANAFKIAKQRFPKASVVILGPDQPRFPEKGDLREVDGIIATQAEFAQLNYISPEKEGWFTPENAKEYIVAADAYHPNNAGHAYFEQRLLADLKKISR